MLALYHVRSGPYLPVLYRSCSCQYVSVYYSVRLTSCDGFCFGGVRSLVLGPSQHRLLCSNESLSM